MAIICYKIDKGHLQDALLLYGGIFVEKKYKVIVLLLCVAAFILGGHVRAWLHTCPVTEPEIKTEVKYKTDTKTEIVYVPKYIYQDGSTEKQMLM